MKDGVGEILRQRKMMQERTVRRQDNIQEVCQQDFGGKEMYKR